VDRSCSTQRGTRNTQFCSESIKGGDVSEDRDRHKGKCCIVMDLREMAFEGMEWIQVA
jgi:hypothetical protein